MASGFIIAKVLKHNDYQFRENFLTTRKMGTMNTTVRGSLCVARMFQYNLKLVDFLFWQTKLFSATIIKKFGDFGAILNEIIVKTLAPLNLPKN